MTDLLLMHNQVMLMYISISCSMFVGLVYMAHICPDLRAFWLMTCFYLAIHLKFVLLVNQIR
jgi:hypothetical protein